MTDPGLKQIWERVFSRLRNQHPDVCRQWFRDLRPIGKVDGSWRVLVDNAVQKNYLQKQCAGLFNEILQEVTGELVPVLFVEQNEQSTAAMSNGSAGQRKPSANGFICEDIIINPENSFENFVEGPTNRLALAAAHAVAAEPGTAYNPLFIHGNVGLGKTHLLQAICQELLEKNPQAEILYISCEQFISLFIESVQSGQCSAFRDRFRHVDALVIDDIHFLASRDRTQEEFFHTFNTLYQSRKQIILSCDAKPDEIPHLEERLVSRFKWGLVAEIQAPCYETRVAIVKRKAALRELDLPDDVVEYIARVADRNIRELEGAITNVQGQALLTDGHIDLDVAIAALGEKQLPADNSRAVNIQDIINTVVDFYNVKVTDLQSKKRQRSVTLPRQICMYLARQYTNHSLVEIGGFFGGRDHTTVMHAINTISERCELYENLRNDLNVLKKKLSPQSD